jgi:hypothetical protein
MKPDFSFLIGLNFQFADDSELGIDCLDRKAE